MVVVREEPGQSGDRVVTPPALDAVLGEARATLSSFLGEFTAKEAVHEVWDSDPRNLSCMVSALQAQSWVFGERAPLEQQVTVSHDATLLTALLPGWTGSGCPGAGAVRGIGLGPRIELRRRAATVACVLDLLQHIAVAGGDPPAGVFSDPDVQARWLRVWEDAVRLEGGSDRFEAVRSSAPQWTRAWWPFHLLRPHARPKSKGRHGASRSARAVVCKAWARS